MVLRKIWRARCGEESITNPKYLSKQVLKEREKYHFDVEYDLFNKQIVNFKKCCFAIHEYFDSYLFLQCSYI